VAVIAAADGKQQAELERIAPGTSRRDPLREYITDALIAACFREVARDIQHDIRCRDERVRERSVGRRI
jgi:hypothetical protein